MSTAYDHIPHRECGVRSFFWRVCWEGWNRPVRGTNEWTFSFLFSLYIKRVVNVCVCFGGVWILIFLLYVYKHIVWMFVCFGGCVIFILNWHTFYLCFLQRTALLYFFSSIDFKVLRFCVFDSNWCHWTQSDFEIQWTRLWNERINWCII